MFVKDKFQGCRQSSGVKLAIACFVKFLFECNEYECSPEGIED